VDVTTEVYPYTASSTKLESALFDPGWQQRAGITYQDIIWVPTGERLTKETFERYRPQRGWVIVDSMTEATVQTALAHPGVIVASDGVPFVTARRTRAALAHTRASPRSTSPREDRPASPTCWSAAPSWCAIRAWSRVCSRAEPCAGSSLLPPPPRGELRTVRHVRPADDPGRPRPSPRVLRGEGSSLPRCAQAATASTGMPRLAFSFLRFSTSSVRISSATFGFSCIHLHAASRPCAIRSPRHE
jgi:hypothetical protein